MTTPDEGNAAQVAYWNDRAALTWTAQQARIDAVFAPLTGAALAAAAPRAGERVLDVGCGCGATVLELARRVGAAGHVRGLDVSRPMAARARERIAEAGLANADVQVADAAVQDFTAGGPAGRADLLFSRFGVMFFADPVAAFANLRRAMGEGGRLLFAAWTPLADNPWFAVPLHAGAPLLPEAAPGDPHAPGPFAFAQPGRAADILARAGWRDPAAARHETRMRLAPAGDLEGATDFATRVGPLARALVEADEGARARARAAVAAALRPYDGPDGVALGGAVWLVSARA